jgi:hypothetical protein
VNIDDELLAEAKLLAARTHRTIGSVLEDALRRLLVNDEETQRPRERYDLPAFHYSGGLRPGVDLYDKELMADVLRPADAPA